MQFDFLDTNLLISVIQFVLFVAYAGYLAFWVKKQVKKEGSTFTTGFAVGMGIRVFVGVLLVIMLRHGINIDTPEQNRGMDDSYLEVLDTSATIEEIVVKDSLRTVKLMTDLGTPSLEEDEKANQAKIDSVLKRYQ